MFACRALQQFSKVFIGGLQGSLGINQVRYARRTCKRAPWQVKKKIVPFWNEKELTPINKQFIKDSHVDYITKKPVIDAEVQTPEWNLDTYRTGVIALKLGVIPQWTEQGKKFYCTVLQVLDNHVIRSSEIGQLWNRAKKFLKNKEQKMMSVVVGDVSTTTEKFTKAYCSLFKEAGVLPKRRLTRFFVSEESILPAGTPLDASHFKVGQYVDAQAKSIGRGFQGVVTRWNFKGGPASHGNTKWHRRPGNIAGGRGKAKVFKGKKMPGHMGMEWRTTRGLKIWRINTVHNVLYVQGQGIPGPNLGPVRLYDTLVEEKRKLMLKNDLPVPTRIKSIEDKEPEDIYHEGLLNLSDSFSAMNMEINEKK